MTKKEVLFSFLYVITLFNPLNPQPPSPGLPSQIQENTGMLLVSCKNW